MEDPRLEEHIGFLASDLHRLISTAADRHMSKDKLMSDLGLTRAQLRVILHLMRSDGISQVELAQRMDIGKAAAGGLIDRLIDKKLLRRKTDPADRRAKLVYVTKKVERLQGKIEDLGLDLMHQLFTGISKKNREIMVKGMAQLKLNTLEYLDQQNQDAAKEKAKTNK